MTEPPLRQELRIIATIVDYDGLIEAIRARIVDLGTCIPSVDTVAGLPEDYTGKVLRQVRSIGPVSLGPLLGALQAKLLMVPDEEADYKIHHGLNRLKKRGTKGPRLDANAGVNAGERKSRKGRILRVKQLLTSSAPQRSMTARIAACVRWQKHRAKQAKLARRRELRRKLMEAASDTR